MNFKFAALYNAQTATAAVNMVPFIRVRFLIRAFEILIIVTFYENLLKNIHFIPLNPITVTTIHHGAAC